MKFNRKTTLTAHLFLAGLLSLAGCKKVNDLAGEDPVIGTPTPTPSVEESITPTPVVSTETTTAPTLQTPAEMTSAPVALSPNQLSDASSLYLRQSAESPVNWQLWNDDTFRAAQAMNRPILIDLGVSWSRRANQMNATTYDNEEVASLLNEKFVPVKVDADERPDIAGRYQTAFELINKRPADYPLIIFALPDGRLIDIMGPVSVNSEEGTPGLKDLLNQVTILLTENKDAALSQATGIENAITKLFIPAAQPTVSDFSSTDYGSVLQRSLNKMEAGIPPYSTAINSFLISNGSSENSTFASNNLLEIFRSGQRDHVLGGYFSRNSQNDILFGKLLPTQTGFITANILAYEKTKKGLHKEAVEEVLRFLADTFENQSGGFFSSQTPDIDAQDNASYFTWTADEIRSLVSSSADATVFSTYLNASVTGENGKANLHVKARLQSAADAAGVSYDEALKALDRARLALTEARLTQEKFPYVNKEVIAAWNAEMISAFLKASEVLGIEHCKEFALKSADFIITNMISENDGVARVFYKDTPSQYGILEDNVLLAATLLDCYDVTKQSEYLDGARSMMDFANGVFMDKESGLYFDTAELGTDKNGLLKFRRISLEDGKTSNANAVAAMNWARIGKATEDDNAKARAKQMVESARKRITVSTPAHISWANAIEFVK